MLFSNFLRRTSALVLITFTSLTMQPLQAAMQLPKAERAKPLAASPDEKFSRALADIHEILKQLAPAAAMPTALTGKQKTIRAIGPDIKIIVEEDIKPMPGVNVAAKMKELRSKLKDIGDYSQAAEQSFADVEKHLKEKKLPAEILVRHEAAVKEYQARKNEFETLTKAVIAADDSANKKTLPGALNALGAFFAKYPNEKTHTPTDPNKLPWRTPDGKVRKPFETEKAFKTSLFKEPRTHLAGPIPWGLTLPETNLPATPVAADLAPTEDVQITPAIQALADSLGKNPVKIYNWVRNNIEFLPTYGSIQGADMTLQTKRGNAFDTASLLIGLLRASGIPARYVYGTIEVPADKAMNWVGGVTKPEAAQSLLGQGGIPNIGVIAGGTMRSIKLEHVWVEAWVDYVPSRGAVNKVGDTWVKMDASFKQYAYTQGIDIKTAVPLDANALITQAQTGATINQAEGWVQNLNQANIQTALTNYQNQVKTYIDTAKPNATVGDVLGTKKIVPHNYSIMLGTLPYKTIATGGKFNVLPDMVRHQFQYNLYASSYDVALENTFLSFKQSLPRLAGKKITLSFAPASQADANLIASYLPKAHADGTPIQPSELPTSLPGYLIHLTAELRVDGQVIASGGNFTMGTELASNMGLFDPTSGWEYGDVNRPIVGEYVASAVDGAGISSSHLQALKDRLAATKTKIEAAQYAGITKEDMGGDLLYSAVMTFFATNQADAQIEQKTADVVGYHKPSFGNFSASVQPAYWFGIPRNVTFPGVVMDIDRYATMVVAKDNDSTKANIFYRQAGVRLSAFEHSIPEKIFTDPNEPTPPQGISAVKALALASSQGQRIYTLNAQNQASHATLLAQITIDTEAKVEIQNALAVGKEIITHATPINQSGWVGSGYLILDPETGAGAYKISGGVNGGYYTLVGLALGLVIGIAAIVASPFVVALVGAIGVLITLINLFTLDNTNNLNFSGARLLATIAGLALAIILGGYVFVLASPLFLIGLFILAVSVLRMLVIELVTHLATTTSLRLQKWLLAKNLPTMIPNALTRI